MQIPQLSQETINSRKKMMKKDFVMNCGDVKGDGRAKNRFWCRAMVTPPPTPSTKSFLKDIVIVPSLLLFLDYFNI